MANWCESSEQEFNFNEVARRAESLDCSLFIDETSYVLVQRGDQEILQTLQAVIDLLDRMEEAANNG